ncbi:MAG: acyl-ACP--UDP-N-acetylglucosamine O-acyltransferase [Planctomycetota bacterium]|nr:acyl-ACP--UDP-N-acetylglucosamine O-acyltransferase [Planctomycetota bacterium]
MIHPTAIVDPAARVGKGVRIGAYSVIGPEVSIGDRTEIRNHVTISGWTEIGSDCVIHPYAAIGGEPQDLKYAGEKTRVKIGDRNVLREYVTVHAGTALGGGVTEIGNDNLLMAYVHIAHDCRLGDRIILANGAQLAGHIVVEDGARIGGMAGLHHFVTVGRCAFVGAMARITSDVPPYLIVEGHPAKVRGLNMEGIRRRGLPDDVVAALKEAYLLLFVKGLQRKDALEAIAARGLDRVGEVKYLLDFLARSEKGRQGRALEAARVDLPPELRDGNLGKANVQPAGGDGRSAVGKASG